MVKAFVLFLCEFTGTAMLMGLGCLGCVSTNYYVRTNVENATAFGLCIMISIQLFAPISGAHINPWVSTAALIMGQLNWQLWFVYIVAQLTGGMAGYGVLYFVVPHKHFNAGAGLCVADSKVEAENWKIFLGEFLATSVLIFVFCSVLDKRHEAYAAATEIRFGFIVAGLICCVGYWTGTSMNLARSLPPVVFHGGWKEMPYFFAGQLTAALIIPTIWRFIFINPFKMNEEEFQNEVK